MNVNILDTAGKEKLKAISESYYKNADCCLLVYDVNDRESFEECKNYYNPPLRDKCKKIIIKAIHLGNKTDLEDLRKVKQEKGSAFALECNYIFIEISSLKNKNAASAFETLIEISNIEAKKSKKGF